MTDLDVKTDQLELSAQAELDSLSDLRVIRDEVLLEFDKLISKAVDIQTARSNLITELEDAKNQIQIYLDSTQAIIVDCPPIIKRKEQELLEFPERTYLLSEIDTFTRALNEANLDLPIIEGYIKDLTAKIVIQTATQGSDTDLIDQLEICKETIGHTSHILSLRSEIASKVIRFAEEITETDFLFSGKLNVFAEFQGDANEYLQTLIDYDGTALIFNGINIDDIDQQDLGNCWLVALIASMADQDPGSIENIITVIGLNTYRIKLYDTDGNSFYVTVSKDDIEEFERVNDASGASKAQEEWVNVLEIALSKAGDRVFTTRDYRAGRDGVQTSGNLNGGSSVDYAEAYRALTGEDMDQTSEIKNGNPVLNMVSADFIKEALQSGSIVTAYTPSENMEGAPDAFTTSHQYTVTRVFTRGGVEYIEMRNPWGTGEGTDEGYFSVTEEDFSRYWAGLMVSQD